VSGEGSERRKPASVCKGGLLNQKNPHFRIPRTWVTSPHFAGHVSSGR
jgi:hypothetical protein